MSRVTVSEPDEILSLGSCMGFALKTMKSCSIRGLSFALYPIYSGAYLSNRYLSFIDQVLSIKTYYESKWQEENGQRFVKWIRCEGRRRG